MHSGAWWPTTMLLATATFTDLRSRKIPNWLVFPFLLAGPLVAGYMRGWAGIKESLSGFALGILICGVLGFLGGMGMGDVKLCAAIGAWVGPSQLLTALIFTGLAGGLMALVWAVAGGFLGATISNIGKLVNHFARSGMRQHPELVIANPLARKLPYAPAIALGTLASFLTR